jgi:isoleucyl-tRNA synthetase
MFKQLSDDQTYSAHENGQLKFWTDIDLINKLDDNSTENDVYRFQDGPPFVSGDLHIGHMAISSFKSMVLNYQRQKGKRCLNKLGYDCHGLPVENRICKERGLDTIADIEKVGVDVFCGWCKDMIEKYSNPSNPESWPPAMWRIGRWADYLNTYKTMDVNYMESCWHVFKTMFDKNLVYMGYKVVPYSWKCQTSLSNFEATQNYVEKKTKSVYVLFPSKNEDNTFYVAWTTTVWTLPSNMALCVGPNIDYVKIESNGKNYYISNATITKLFKEGTFKVIETMKGLDLEGREYIPIFDCFKDRSGLFRVLVDPYVKDAVDSGTGIVHQSPPFGEDDFNIGVKNNLVTNTNINEFCTVDEFGNFNELFPEFQGKHVCEDETTIALIISIKTLGLFVKTEMYTHNYPYCWRTDTPLIYRVVKSVFIKVSTLTDQMLALNEKINWHPSHIGDRRFKNWLENSKDWAVSRTRYFGTPVPLWVDEDGEMMCIGSRAELAELTGKSESSYKDIHKELMDLETFVKDGKTFRRIPEIFDCWFESGCVPFAQIHYPFENKELIDSVDHLADFIVEGLDQTRGWFYTLLVVATAMTDGKKIPFKNVICTGMILDEFGNKISKRIGNDIDTKAYLLKYGADVLRSYLIGSPLVNAEPLKFTPTSVDSLKKNQIRYINGVKFFLEHALNFQKNSHTFLVLGRDMKFNEVTDLFDKWILSRLSDLSESIDDDMQHYRLNKVVERELDFIEDIVNWYIKFNRSRIKGMYGDKEWSKSLSVLHFVLHTYARLCSPVTPFLSELVHQNIYVPIVEDAEESIHFMKYPEFSSMVDIKLEKVFKYLKMICEGVRMLRDKSEEHGSIKMPIKLCVIYHDDEELLNLLSANINTVQEEINSISVDYKTLNDNVAYSIEPNFKTIGKKFGKLTGQVTQTMRSLLSDSISSMDTNFDMVIDGVSLTITPECYTLHKKPVASGNKLTTILINDIMIGVDFILDDEVKFDYISKCMHSNIQNTRKDMGFRPWDKIDVVLCKELMKHVSDLPTRLLLSLTNSNVTWSNTESQEFVINTEIKMRESVFNCSYTVTKHS